MLLVILVALVIVAFAVIGGIFAHPLLWLLLILAVVWLFMRRGDLSRR